MIMSILELNGIKTAMESNKGNRVLDVLIKVVFALLFMGSVFIVSASNYDLFDTYRKYWTIIGGLILLILFSLTLIIGKGKIPFPVGFNLKVVFAAGVSDSLYALAQFLKVLPSYNRYYTYTGSFENPAVFSMLLSLCVPIGVYLGYKNSDSKKTREIWWMLSFMLLVFIGFSESRTGFIAAVVSSFIVIISESDSIRTRILNKRTLSILIPIGLIVLFLLYRFKADSANGRLLMWRVCWEIIKDKPFVGFGLNGFTAHYMQYQADYLALHPDSPFILLADNVNNPFNEYLLVLVNYGITGFLVLLGLLALLFRKMLRQPNDYRYLLIGLALAVMIWSFFSYPFSMPFIWVITALIALSALSGTGREIKVIIPVVTIVFSLIGIVLSVRCFRPEREWKVISQRSLMGETEAVLPDYERLHDRLKRNGNFLYNYGAELHYSKHYQESLNILDECERLINDYDVLMLEGDCYQNLGDTLMAIGYYDQAGGMVPSRFLPLYYKMNLFKEMGDTASSVETAKKIVNKDIKVEKSKTTQRIVREATGLLNDINN